MVQVLADRSLKVSLRGVVIAFGRYSESIVNFSECLVLLVGSLAIPVTSTKPLVAIYMIFAAAVNDI